MDRVSVVLRSTDWSVVGTADHGGHRILEVVELEQEELGEKP